MSHYISPKRTPAPTPESIVENGKVHYGTFDAPFKNLNLLDANKPCGPRMPDFLKRSRLTEWEAFEVHMDEGALISAVYIMGPLAFNIFVWYDKATEKISAWRNFVFPASKGKVASQLVDDHCYLATKNSEYRINNDFLNGKASAKGFSKSNIGTFEIDMGFDRISPSAVGVMPLKKDKQGNFKNALYSEKDFFKATGHITVNGARYDTNENSVGIIDDHKGYYPFRAHYDWLTSMGTIDDNGEKKYFAFNLTRNQSVDQESYNENVIWIENESYPMPPVVFKHKDGKKKAKEWRVVDEKEEGIVDVKFEIKNVFYMPIHLGLVDVYYALPYGNISGYVTDTNGKRYVVDGMIGIGEDKTTRI